MVAGGHSATFVDVIAARSSDRTLQTEPISSLVFSHLPYFIGTSSCGHTTAIAELTTGTVYLASTSTLSNSTSTIITDTTTT